MTQAAKDRKGFLILGAARGDFNKGRKESTRTGMYTGSGRTGSWPGWCPAVLAPPPAHCPAVSRVTPEGQSAGPCPRTARSRRPSTLVAQACGGSDCLPPAAASGSAPPCPAGPAASPSVCWSAAPPLLCLSSSLSPEGNKQSKSISREGNSLPPTKQGTLSSPVSTRTALCL